MEEFKLKDIDAEDIDDLLMEVEKSFGIQFDENELIYLTTIGELCNHIANKVQLLDSNDCTTQQAFYKLRIAIATTLQVDIKSISPSTAVAHILPPSDRRRKINRIEKKLGFALNILRPAHWISTTWTCLFLVSLIFLFFQWPIGLLGLLISTVGMRISSKLAKETDVKKLGQIAEKMCRENYLKSRRYPSTCNRKEINSLLKDWFSEVLLLEKHSLDNHAKQLECKVP